MTDFTIRPATPADVNALKRLEDACFTTDRLTRRQLRHLILHAHATVLVGLLASEAVAAIVVLYRKGSDIARIYSLAVDARMRRQGLGKSLLGAAEHVAALGGRRRMRLEVEDDNQAAIHLYESCGYQSIARLPGYYENGAIARRLEKNVNRA